MWGWQIALPSRGTEDQAQVVQRLDSSIHRINHYPQIPAILE